MALIYLSSVFEGIPNAEELLQLVELEFIRKDAVQNSQNKVSEVRERQEYFADLLGSLFTTNIRSSRSKCLHRRI